MHFDQMGRSASGRVKNTNNPCEITCMLNAFSLRAASRNEKQERDVKTNKCDVKPSNKDMSAGDLPGNKLGPLIYLMQGPVGSARFNVHYNHKIRCRTEMA